MDAMYEVNIKEEVKIAAEMALKERSQFFKAVTALRTAEMAEESPEKIAPLRAAVDDMRLGFKELSAAEVQEVLAEFQAAIWNAAPEAAAYKAACDLYRQFPDWPEPEPPADLELKMEELEEAELLYGKEMDNLANLLNDKQREEKNLVNELPKQLTCTSLENMAVQLRILAKAFKPTAAQNIIPEWDIPFHGVRVAVTIEPTNPQLDDSWATAVKINRCLGAGEKEFAREGTMEGRDLKFTIRVVGPIPKTEVKKSGYWSYGIWRTYT